MATYNKRGYKAPKPEEEKEAGEFDQFSQVNAQQSTTADVFNSLDKGASKMEGWVARNQKYIFGAVGAIALLTVGYVLYDKFVVEPKNDEAANEMFQAQTYFQDATTNPVASDSLYNLALKGGEGKLGFIGITETYSGTESANLANYYAGMAYLNLGKNKEAIAHLEKFTSKDMLLGSLALGGIGDAFSELNQKEDAFEFYKKAAEMNKNDFTTPRFLNKAGMVALDLGKKEEALKLFNDIKNNYQASSEANTVDMMIGMAQ